jgi:hypothetical protein
VPVGNLADDAVVNIQFLGQAPNSASIAYRFDEAHGVDSASMEVGRPQPLPSRRRCRSTRQRTAARLETVTVLHLYFRLGSVAASGRNNLNDCFQSDPAAVEFSWFAVRNRPIGDRRRRAKQTFNV